MEVSHAESVDVLVDQDLERSQGAMAHMNIDSSAERTPPHEDEDVELDHEDAAVVAPTSAALVAPEVSLPSGMDGVVEQDQFIVDVAGDASLKPRGPPPVMRSSSPTPSSSSEDVVIFRGRRDPITVRDDIPTTVPQRERPSAGPTREVHAPVTAASPTSHVTDKLLVALEARKEPEQPTQSWGEAAHPQEAPRQQTSGEGWGSLAPKWRYGEPGWKHADGTRGLQSYTVAQDTWANPESDEWDTRDAKSRKGKKARKEQNRALRAGSPELSDEVVRDYIQNVTGVQSMQPANSKSATEDDWVSSELSEAEETEISNNGKRRKGFGNDGYLSATYRSDEGDDDDDFHDDSIDDDESDEEDGDDTSLEDELEYAEREIWEDEADLRQRQQDAMTDEEIARILAKQEELGISGDDMVLFNDSGFGDVETARAGLESVIGGRKAGKRRSKGGRKSDHFPDATLMADVLEQDPYGGFDIMDFDRPSLKNKAKGRKSFPDEIAGLSDEELIADLQSSWAADRKKKKARKAEREELRAQGLLGRGKKHNRPDLGVRYAEGMNMRQLRDEMRAFLEDDDDEGNASKAFPPMDKDARKVLHQVAAHFDVKSTSRGSGKNRFTVLSKTRRTRGWSDEHWAVVMSWTEQGFLPNLRTKGRKGNAGGGGGGKGASARPKRNGAGGAGGGLGGYRNGEVVGATAPEIAEGSFGRRLMEKMGWQKGMALGREGVEGGLLVPVAARIKSGRGGLG